MPMQHATCTVSCKGGLLPSWSELGSPALVLYLCTRLKWCASLPAHNMKSQKRADSHVIPGGRHSHYAAVASQLAAAAGKGSGAPSHS